MTSGGSISTVAGTGSTGFSGDGGAATNATLAQPTGVAVDAAGNLYVADSANARVRKVSPTGTISTVAGNGAHGFSGDGGPATNASLTIPYGVTVDTAGNLYIADAEGNRVRKVSPAGTISTVAGNGGSGSSGDGGQATAATIDFPVGVAVDAAGNLYIAEVSGYRVRKVTPDGTISTVAVATERVEEFVAVMGVTVDAAGNVYYSDTSDSRVRKLLPDGTITVVAGNGGRGYSGDGGPAPSARLFAPQGLAVDATGNLYIADRNSLNRNGQVRKVSPAGTISTVAGKASLSSGDGGTATGASLASASGVAVDAAGDMYIADQHDNRVRKVTAAGRITTVAGNGTAGFSGDGGPATAAQLSWPQELAVDAAGNLYIADRNNNRVRKVSSAGIITTVAGNGATSPLGDGGPASSAALASPEGVAVDTAGNLYIADGGHSRVRKVSSAGTITTVAGNGLLGQSGDGGPATAATISAPEALAVDTAGNLYIADDDHCAGSGCSFRSMVRVVSPAGIISTLAGNGNPAGFSGDGGPAADAGLSDALGLAVDAIGNVYIADLNRVRRVSPAGTITTVAGNGASATSGDGGPAFNATLNAYAVAVDSAGNLHIADPDSGRVRKVINP